MALSKATCQLLNFSSSLKCTINQGRFERVLENKIIFFLPALANSSVGASKAMCYEEEVIKQLKKTSETEKNVSEILLRLLL